MNAAVIVIICAASILLQSIAAVTRSRCPGRVHQELERAAKDAQALRLLQLVVDVGGVRGDVQVSPGGLRREPDGHAPGPPQPSFRVRSPFAGPELVEPGVVQISRWRLEPELGEQDAAALPGGVARKP